MKNQKTDMIILKAVTLIFAAMFTMAVLSSCSSAKADGEKASGTSGTVNIEDYYDETDANTEYNSLSAAKITLNGGDISINGSGASCKGSVLTIFASGTYYITGNLNDGQIIVNNTTDKELIHIIFDGVSISCSYSSPVYIIESKRTVITLKENSENTLTDSENYTLADPANEEPDAALFSKDTLTINGNGKLTVNGNYNHGIHGKDDLKIINTYITVTSVNDALKGRDSVVIIGSAVNLTAGGDGAQSNNTGEDEAAENETGRLYGIVLLKDNEMTVTAQEDGIQAVNYLYVASGKYTVTTAGGSTEVTQNDPMMQFGFGYTQQGTEDDGQSAKAFKSDAELVIDEGEFHIDSYDDALHSNGNVTVNGGSFEISTSDDGMHADDSLTVNDASISISRSYEGLEGSEITINGGDISLVSADDGLNAAGSESEQSEANPSRGGGMMNETGDSNIIINSGTVYVNAEGDGLDANGTIYINGGTVLVDGPTDNGNGALDYYNGLEMNGGLLIAAGSVGMAEGVSSAGDEVCALNITLSSTQSANTLVHIEDESGRSIITYSPAKAYQSVIICSDKLKVSSAHSLYTGGTAAGETVHGLYSDETYTAGTLQQTFTIEQSIMSIGSGASFNNPGGGGMMQMPGGEQTPNRQTPGGMR